MLFAGVMEIYKCYLCNAILATDILINFIHRKKFDSIINNFALFMIPLRNSIF